MSGDKEYRYWRPTPFDKLEAENERLRKALAVFADKRNWMSYSPGYGRPAHVGWNGGRIPWLLAQEALDAK